MLCVPHAFTRLRCGHTLHVPLPCSLRFAHLRLCLVGVWQGKVYRNAAYAKELATTAFEDVHTLYDAFQCVCFTSLCWSSVPFLMFLFFRSIPFAGACSS